MSEKEVKVKSIQDFIEDSEKLQGWPCAHPGLGWIKNYQIKKKYPVRVEDVQNFSLALGDDNPLYIDPKYGRLSRWGTMIAHPTHISVFRYNIWRGAYGYGQYAVTSLVSGFSWEYNDVIRVGDEFETSCWCKDIIPKKGATGTLCFTYSHSGYWNQFHELVATGRAGNCTIGREQAVESIEKGEGVRTDLVYERGVYHYSEDEINNIVKDIMSEERRGATPRYWEDVQVGDKLAPVVKGPMTTNDLMGWDQAMFGAALQEEDAMEDRGNFELAIRRIIEWKEDSLNTMTGFPYDASVGGHYDWDGVKARGMPAPFDVGVFRACAISHLLSNWMGDDGFIRRFEMQLRKPKFYGDTTWYYAEVVKKHKDNIGDEEYGAVDIKITGTNQIGEVSTPAKATVYLPSPGRPVKLPVPHDDNYGEYIEYIKRCDELREQREKTGNPFWPIEH